MLFIGINLILASISVLLNVKINGYLFFFSFLLVCSFLFFYIKKHKYQFVKTFSLTIFLFIITITLCTILTGKIYDFSWDGQTYHQEAILQLQEGWNPLYDEDLEEESTKNLHADYRSNFWINHYAKGNWYLAVIPFDLFGSIEYGKAFHLLTLIATFLISFSFLHSLLQRPFVSFILSLIIVLNPVSWNQTFTFYNDGFLYLFFVLLVILSIEWLQRRDILSLLAYCFAIIIIVNTKFTALGYAIILCGIPLFIIIYKHWGNLKSAFSKDYIKLYLAAIVSFIFAVGIVGSGSYIKNFIDHKHPFYPLAGDGKVDIITHNTPDAFKKLSTFEQFYISLFSKTSNDRKNVPEKKLPFSITKEEIEASIKVDTRLAGFGPLFSTVIILILFILIMNYRMFIDKKNIYYGIVLSILLISVIINPEPWWARYIPQFWLIPIVMLLVIIVNYFNRNKWIIYFTLTVFLLNSLIISSYSIKNTIENQNNIEEQLAVLKKYSEEEEVAVHFDAFLSNRNRLEEKGIRYKEISDVKEYMYAINLVASTTKICTNDKQLYEQLKNAIR